MEAFEGLCQNWYRIEELDLNPLLVNLEFLGCSTSLHEYDKEDLLKQ